MAVAQLASEDKTNREIAETLFISPHTVNTYPDIAASLILRAIATTRGPI